jgi:hypothetical protein
VGEDHGVCDEPRAYCRSLLPRAVPNGDVGKRIAKDPGPHAPGVGVPLPGSHGEYGHDFSSYCPFSRSQRRPTRGGIPLA